MSRKCAYVTLLSRTSYLSGTLVLDYGLRAVKSQYPLVVMVTPTLPEEAKDILRKRNIPLREVQPLNPKENVHSTSSPDARFIEVWSKLRVFELVEYDRVVLLDCDMIVRKNLDELMSLDLPPDEIAAAHVCACNPRKFKHYPADWIPENCPHSAVPHPLASPPVATPNSPRPYHQLNSGTVVLNPSHELFNSITRFLWSNDRISEMKFADQDLLIAFFRGKWRPLPWYYNALKTLPLAHKQMWSDDEVRCLHYILQDKPWQARITPPEFEQYTVVNSWWWDQFDSLGKDMSVSDPAGWKLVLQNVDKGY